MLQLCYYGDGGDVAGRGAGAAGAQQDTAGTRGRGRGIDASGSGGERRGAAATRRGGAGWRRGRGVRRGATGARRRGSDGDTTRTNRKGSGGGPPGSHERLRPVTGATPPLEGWSEDDAGWGGRAGASVDTPHARLTRSPARRPASGGAPGWRRQRPSERTGEPSLTTVPAAPPWPAHSRGSPARRVLDRLVPLGLPEFCQPLPLSLLISPLSQQNAALDLHRTVRQERHNQRERAGEGGKATDVAWSRGMESARDAASAASVAGRRLHIPPPRMRGGASVTRTASAGAASSAVCRRAATRTHWRSRAPATVSSFSLYEASSVV